MSEPSWRLGALATSAGLAVFAWGLAVGGADDTLATRVLAWPRSHESAGAAYALQLVSVGDVATPLAHTRIECSGETLDTDESGYLLFPEPGALPLRSCSTPQGPVTLGAAALPPLGREAWSEPVRAQVNPVSLHDAAPELFLAQAELTIDQDVMAWLQIAPDRSEHFVAKPEPGLDVRVLAQCDDGIALSLRASFHVTGLHLEWGAAAARERLAVLTPVSHGGPRASVAEEADGRRFAHVDAARGWLALFDATGLISSSMAADEPWPLPRVEHASLLVATTGSFFDSAATYVRVEAPALPCTHARSLGERWPAPQPAVVLVDGVERAQTLRRMQNARGRRTAGFGLAAGLLGLAAALFASKNANVTARALGALAITSVLFGILAMLLYAA